MSLTVLARFRTHRHCPDPAFKVHVLEFTEIFILLFVVVLLFLFFGLECCLDKDNPISEDIVYDMKKKRKCGSVLALITYLK